MDKRTIAQLASAMLGILLLSGLAVLVHRDVDRLESESMDLSVGTSFQTALLNAEEERSIESPAAEDARLSETPSLMESEALSFVEAKASGTLFQAGQGGILPKHRILFVGDSRTVGMQSALEKQRIGDLCLSVAEVGEGCAWFNETGRKRMASILRVNPDLRVVLNLGVNDPDQIERYLSAYREIIRDFPETDFWFLSVNPIDHDLMAEMDFSPISLDLITQERVDALNEALREAFPERYLDSASMLEETGFETADGIHYSPDTYLKIHDFVVNSLF